MTDYSLPSDREAADGLAYGARLWRALAHRIRPVLTLRVMVFGTMMFMAVLPIVAFYKWVERTSFEKEIALVDESHLIIAKNLSAAFSRYVQDAKSVFGLAVQNAGWFPEFDGYTGALANFNFCHIVVVDGAGRVIQVIEGDNEHATDLPDPAIMAELREIAAQAGGEIAVSGIRPHNGAAHFFMVQQLAGDHLAIAPWSPAYVVKMQKSIAFGELGHSMVVDHEGRVVAHPNAEWQRISKDASKLSVVQAMLRGETGVMQFYSPPMQADMIAGYTFVPETGWGVMVPQPIRELADRAGTVQSGAVALALFQLSLAILISWWLASWISRPIRAIARSSVQVSQGDYDARVPTPPRHTAVEIQQTAAAFNTMVDGIRDRRERLKAALFRAESVSRERAALLEAAEQANRAKSSFVSMVSHELRTPLTSVKAAMELIDSGATGEVTPEAKSLLGIAIKNSRRLGTMINDLLDMEKLNAGEMRFTFARLNLAALAADAVRENASYAKLNDVTFEIDAPEGPVMVEGDFNRLTQVMANLLSNAAKFSHAGGTVEVSVFTDGNRAIVDVRDHGIGIPPDVGDRIFETFVQLDSADNRAVGGSGLGLGIARTIVARHRGKLGYHPADGGGTVFRFVLPLATDDGTGEPEGNAAT